MHREKKCKSFYQFWEAAFRITVCRFWNEAIQSFQKVLRQTLGKGSCRIKFTWTERRINIKGTMMMSYCENQTGLESDRLKEFNAIRVTQSRSPYGEVPADWRLAHSKRKNKTYGGTGQTGSSVALFCCTVPVAGAAWSRDPQYEHMIYFHDIGIIYSPEEWRLTRVQCPWKAVTPEWWMRHQG